MAKFRHIWTHWKRCTLRVLSTKSVIIQLEPDQKLFQNKYERDLYKQKISFRNQERKAALKIGSCKFRFLIFSTIFLISNQSFYLISKTDKFMLALECIPVVIGRVLISRMRPNQ